MEPQAQTHTKKRKERKKEPQLQRIKSNLQQKELSSKLYIHWSQQNHLVLA